MHRKKQDKEDRKSENSDDRIVYEALDESSIDDAKKATRLVAKERNF